MFVKKTTKYWKEVTTSEEVEYTILYSRLGDVSAAPVFAVRGDPEAGKKLYNLKNMNVELVNNTLVYTFDIDKSDSGYTIVSVSGEKVDPVNGAFTYKEVVITPNKPGLAGGNTVSWSLSTTYTKTEIETVTVTQPATPDDYTYKEEDLKTYAITKGDKRYIPIVKRWGKLDFQFEYASAGTYTVEIPHDGEYELTVVGGGAGGAFVYSAKFWDGAAAGGSGGGFIGVTHLTKGTYTVTVGAGGAGNFNNNSATSCTAGYGGDSKFGDIVTAGGATAPTARYDAQSQTGSIGGTVRYDVSDFSSVSLSSNGNTGYGSNQADGGTYAGGASVYEGYGAGGQAAHGACKAGTAGYVKIKAVNVYGYKETYY